MSYSLVGHHNTNYMGKARALQRGFSRDGGGENRRAELGNGVFFIIGGKIKDPSEHDWANVDWGVRYSW